MEDGMTKLNETMPLPTMECIVTEEPVVSDTSPVNTSEDLRPLNMVDTWGRVNADDY